MKQWFKNIFDKESNVSSKRLVGVVMVAWTLVAGTYFVVFKDSQTSDAKALIEWMAATGAGLLGVGVLDKIRKKE